jgi:hypothetical protein
MYDHQQKRNVKKKVKKTFLIGRFVACQFWPTKNYYKNFIVFLIIEIKI